MKKILLFASALAGLFAASCQRENLEPVGPQTVSFTVEAPGALATKGTINAGATIADGTNVNEVHYAVYKTNSGEDYSIDNSGTIDGPLAQGVVPMSNKKATINFDLLQDQNYTVLFWAQVKDADHYNLGDLRTIEVATSVAGNDETRAAFYARYDFETYNHKDHKVTLRRPFAQLNLLTTVESLTPVQTGQTTGYTIDVKTSEVVVTGLATTFNTLTGLAPAGDETFVFQTAETPEEQGQETLVVNGKAYHYVSMNYFFVPGDEKLVDIKYTVNTDKGTIKNEIVAVPVKENYRTNVIGNLLTKESTFEIVVDSDFDGQELVEVWDQREVSEPAMNAEGQYMISTASELAWLAAAVNGTLPVVESKATQVPAAQKFEGKTFVLVEDIDLQNVLWTPIGAKGSFEGTFDGQGRTISNLKVNCTDKTPAGLFANAKYVKNVIVKNAEVKGHYKVGVIVGDGLCSRIDNCHVAEANVLATPLNNDDANHAGGIVGYLSAETEAYVKNSSVANSTITAYRDVAGIAGTANQAAVISNCSVECVTLIADQLPAYVEFKTANLGYIAGRVNAKAQIEGSKVSEVKAIYKVDSTEELDDVLVNGLEGAVIEVAKGSYNALTNVKKNVTIIGSGYEYSAAKPNGTRFYGHSVIATEGVKVMNAQFANPKANYVLNYQNSALHNITFENCWFNDTEGIRYAYAKENVTFNKCIFGNESCVRGVHFDGKKGDAYAHVVFNECTLYGFQALGGGVDKYTFNKCSFPENTRPQNVVNMYGVVEYNDCTFNPLMHCDCAGNGVTADFNNCSYTDGSEITAIVRFDKDPATCTIKFDGLLYKGVGLLEDANGNLLVKTIEGLQAAINNAPQGTTNILFANELVGDVTVLQKEGVNLVIDGDKNNYDGIITVNGDARATGEETLAFKNIAFATAGSDFTFISAPSKIDGRYNYSHNVTIEGCSFTGNKTVGSASFTGTYNLVMKNCTANNMHSILQAQSCDNNVTVDKVTLVDCKSGVSFGNTANAIIKNSTITASGYGVRSEGSADRDLVSLTIENCNIDAYVPVTVRKLNSDAVKFALALNGTNSLVKGGYYHVALCSNEFEEGVDPVEPVGTISHEGTEGLIVYPDFKVDANGNLSDKEGNIVAYNATGLQEALNGGHNVTMAVNFDFAANNSNGYGATGIKQYNGGTIEGNGYEFGANGFGTWDSAITTSGGTIKNLKVVKGFRGIFIKKDSKHNEKVYLDNVIIEGTTYTISCDSGNGLGLEAYNSTFNGWTSFAKTIGDVYFKDCSFGAGAGYNYSRPYAPTTYVNCNFAVGHTVDPRAAVTFENCTVGGVALTAENLATLVTASKIANATVIR